MVSYIQKSTPNWTLKKDNPQSNLFFILFDFYLKPQLILTLLIM